MLRKYLNLMQKLSFRENLGFGILLILALAVRIYVAGISHGFQHPDEHYQILEPAHGIVYGYFDKAWEFERGVRSYALPYFYAGCMIAIKKLVGTEDPWTVVWILRVLSAFLSLMTLVFVFWLGRLFETKKTRNWISFSALAFASFWYLFVYFGVRTQSEPLSMNFIVIGAFLVYRDLVESRAKSFDGFWAGIFLGLAFMVRFQSGIFGLSFLIAYGIRKKWNSLGFLLSGCLLVVGFQGWIDWLTWGSFLHSPIEYFRFNILEGGATALFGRAPWHRYLSYLPRFYTFPIAVMVLLGAFWSCNRSCRERFQFLWIMIIPFWIIHNFIGHKEDRFLLPIAPFIVLLTCCGWAHRLESMSKRCKRTTLVIVSLLMLTCGYYTYRKHVWNWCGDQTQAIAFLSRQNDVRGVAITHLVSSGSYFYLHKKVPLAMFYDEERTNREFYDKIPSVYNYLVLFRDSKTVLDKLEMKNVHCEAMAYNAVFRCELKLPSKSRAMPVDKPKPFIKKK